MAITTEQIIIEFQADPSGLDTTVDKLESLGAVDKQNANAFKATNAELAKKIQLEDKAIQQANKEQAIFNKLVASVKTLTGESKKAVQELLKMSASEVSAGFEHSAVAVDDYILALQQAGKATDGLEDTSVSLKAQLKDLVAQLQRLKLAGKDNTDEYARLNKQAGQLKDTINDVNAEVKNAGSDTRNIDNVLGSVQALTGGFQALQGAQALFGEDNEDLQKTLVKLNGVMALTQGIQQVVNALQKEGSLIKLADVVQTRAQAAAQILYTYTIGASTVALKIFRIALIATGIGAFIALIAFAIEKLKLFTSSTDEAAEAQGRLNDATLRLNESLVESNKAYVRAISERKKALEQELAILEARGATEQELNNKRIEIAREEADIQKKSLENLGLTEVGIARLQLEYDGLTRKLNALAQVIREDPTEERLKAATKIAEQLQAQQAVIKPLIDAGNEALERRALALNELEILEIKNTKIQKDQLEKRLQDELTALQLKLIRAEEGSKEENDIRKKIVAKQAEIDLQQEGLTKNKKLLILAQSQKEQEALTKAFLERVSEISLQNFISDNNRQLQNLNITNSEKLRLLEDNIFAAAQIEIENADGNSKKIKEIEAKRDADVKAVRLKSIQEILDYELAITAANNGPRARALQRIADNEQESLSNRKAAINELRDIELLALDKQLTALNEQRAKKLIGESEYNLKYALIIDAQAKLFEEGEKKKVDAIKKSEAERLKIITETINTVVDAGNRLAGLFDSLNSLRADQDKQRFDMQRNQLAALRESGAITEKQEKERIRTLEAEERKARNLQAQREKQAAIFKGLLAIPQAVLQGLAQGGPPLAALYGALAVAQVAFIAARPIPRFGKGKPKGNRYQGMALTGETGAELIESDGRMYLVNKPTIAYLRADDKVYNPRETREMLYKGKDNVTNNNMTVDADAIGKAVAKHIPQFGLNVDADGFAIWARDKGSFTKYLDNRRFL